MDTQCRCGRPIRENAYGSACEQWPLCEKPLPETKRCTCGASYFRGCCCGLTTAEFMASPYAKGV